MYTERMMPTLRKQFFTALITQSLPQINTQPPPYELLIPSHINPHHTLAQIPRPPITTISSHTLHLHNNVQDLTTPLTQSSSQGKHESNTEHSHIPPSLTSPLHTPLSTNVNIPPTDHINLTLPTLTPLLFIHINPIIQDLHISLPLPNVSKYPDNTTQTLPLTSTTNISPSSLQSLSCTIINIIPTVIKLSTTRPLFSMFNESTKRRGIG